MQQLCLTCRNLNGCELIQGDKQEFLSSKVITEQSSLICPQWSPVGEKELFNRQWAFDRTGMGTIKGINQLHNLILEDTTNKEVDVDALTNFADILREGMTRSERKEQLCFITDKDGNVLSEDGEKLIRGSFPLRKWATDPDGLVKETNDRVMFWNTNQLIDVILNSELDAGLIIPDKKSSKKTTTSATRKKETGMPKLSLRGGKTGGTKVNKEADSKEKIAKPATGGKRSIVTDLKTAPSAVGSLDVEKIVEEVSAKVLEGLAPIIKKKTAEIMANIDFSRERAALNLTTLHDVIALTIIEPERFCSETLLAPDGDTIENYLEEKSEGE